MIKRKLTILLFLLFTMPLIACKGQGHFRVSEGVDFTQLERQNEPLEYATQFSIERIEPYTLVTIEQSKYLIVPEKEEVPSNIDGVTILQQPLDQTYLVATSAMDPIAKIGAIDNLRFSGTKEDGWSIEAAKKAMQDQSLLYAGKYSAPDYELLVSQGCNLAIESTMIYHNPAVKEKLEELGIPVLVERSSYENHPLARLEWVKLYGLLFNKEQEANAYYESQKELISNILDGEKTEKKIAFFSISSNGSVTIHKPNDYIATMIELAGGNYALNDIKSEDENALSTMHMQMEDFYASCIDADILIYNSTIEGEISSISDLIRKDNLFKDFKAVKENNVYCTSKNFFQESTGMAGFMNDIYNVCHEKKDNLHYLNALS